MAYNRSFLSWKNAEIVDAPFPKRFITPLEAIVQDAMLRLSRTKEHGN